MFGDLDEQFFTQLPGPTYPPLVPVLDAAAFHAMGSADVVTLHLQFWFFALGFVAAAAGLLWKHVPGWIALAVPAAHARRCRVPRSISSSPQADFLLQFFFCAAALLAGALARRAVAVARRLRQTVLLGAARPDEARGRAPRGDPSPRRGGRDGATGGGSPGRGSASRRRGGHRRPAVAPLVSRPRDRGRGAESSSRAASDALETRSAWPWTSSSSGRSGPCCRTSRSRPFCSRLSGDAVGSRCSSGSLLLLLPLGGAWFTLAYPELPVTADEALNPIVRYTAAAVLAGRRRDAAAARRACGSGRLPPRAPAAMSGRRLAAPRGGARARCRCSRSRSSSWRDGGARFPSRDECARPGDGRRTGPRRRLRHDSIDLVAAEALLTELTRVGFTGAELELDACGRWRVFYDGIPSLAQGEALVDQVREAGFEARVELEG